jgi:hypothetical protein
MSSAGGCMKLTLLGKGVKGLGRPPRTLQRWLLSRPPFVVLLGKGLKGLGRPAATNAVAMATTWTTGTARGD